MRGHDRHTRLHRDDLRRLRPPRPPVRPEDPRAPWLADEELRARIGRQLNKGEQLHALRRAVFYANEGHVRQRTPDQQGEQALCLAIVVNAIIAWNTVYTGRVLDELRAAGELITTSEIEHISALAHQHIHLYG